MEIFATRSAWGRDFGHQGVAGLVVGDDFLFFRIDDAGFALESGHHPVDGLLEVDHLDRVLPLACGAERGLVDEVGEVGADEPWRARGNLLQIDGRGQRHLPRVHPEDLRPALQVRAGRAPPGGRSGPGAAAPGPGSPVGWWRPGG